MDKVQIKFKNGDSLYLSIKEEGHSDFDDLLIEIEYAQTSVPSFVKFKTCTFDVKEILYVKLVQDDKQKQENQPLKIDPNSLFGVKPNEEIARLLSNDGVKGLLKDIDINRNIPQPKIPDFSNILKKD